jgi:hypothetical protein
MNKNGNPNFKSRWYSGKTSAIRIPECFQDILIYIAEKLDNQLISELDLHRMIEDYINISIKGLSENKSFNHNEAKINTNIKSITIEEFIDKLDDSQKLQVLNKILK